MKSITNRLHQAEERLSGMEEKVEKILRSNFNKEKEIK